MRHAHNWCRPIQLALLCLPALTEWTSHPVDIHRCPGTGELLKIATSNWWCPRRCGGTPFPIWTVRQHLLVQPFFRFEPNTHFDHFSFSKATHELSQPRPSSRMSAAVFQETAWMCAGARVTASDLRDIFIKKYIKCT